MISGKLKQGVTNERVLRDIRDTGDATNFARIHYADKKDLHNIRRDFKIGMSKFHSDDSISIDILVNELYKHEDPPVIYYINNNQEFALIIMTHFQKSMLIEHSSKICVDGTHGMNSKMPKIQLFTLLVIDEYGNGVPGAFFLSNRANKEAMKLFFNKVKEVIGRSIECTIFMSDDDSTLYEAWKEVMGPTEYKLLCWWHVNKNWNKHLNEKIKHKSKRDLVKKTLYSLTTFIENTDVFEIQLQQFLTNLENDIDTLSFQSYFLTYYVPKKKSWAFCYRKYTGINTNMALENLHRKIKYIYLEGKQCTRLDLCVPKLLYLLRDTMYDRIIKIAKNKPSDRIKRINHSHIKSKDLKNEDVEQDTEDLMIYYVTSQTAANYRYKVHILKKHCTESLCVLRCSECNVCIHTHICTCLDSVIYLNLCKHIHKVGSMNPSTEEIDGMKNNQENIGEIEIQQTKQFLEVQTSNKVEELEEIKTKLNTMISYVENPSDECDTKNILKCLDKALSFFKPTTNTSIKKTEDNPLKKISHQNRKWPKTKTRKTVTQLLTKPTTAEKESCIKNLKGDLLVQNVHVDFDHIY